MPKLIVQEDGVSKTEKRTLNFIEGSNITITITDDVVGNQADIQIDSAGGGGGAPTNADYLVGTANGTLSNEIVVGTSPGGELGGTWASPTVDSVHSGSAHHAQSHGQADHTGTGATSTQAFGDAAADGTGTMPAAKDHKHGMPADPVTAHVAAGDPHTGYRLESADHTHQSTGLQGGTLDHGAALTGLSDNDHPQYILHALADAKGDVIAASGVDTFVRVAVGADGTVLQADSAASAGVSWQTPGAGSHPGFTTHAKFGVD